MTATATETKRTIKTGLLYRSAEIDRAMMKDDERTIELSFSSETPIETFNWDIGRFHEILDHSESAVDMTRLDKGAALLVEHNREDQVGVVEKAWIADKKGRALVRFGKSARAEEIFQDVKGGIRRLVSVGYRVREWITEKVEESGLKTMRAVGWMPAEISIVSVPADVSVGVGRSRNDELQETILTERQMKILLKDNAEGGGGGTPPANPNPPANPPATPPPAAMRRTEDVQEMFAIAKRANMLDAYNAALERGLDVNQFRAEVMEKMFGVKQPDVEFAPPKRQQHRSFGEMLVENEIYRAAIKSRTHRSVSLELPILNIRATFLTTTGLTSYDRPPGVVLLEQQPLTVAALFSQGETSATTVRFTREASYTQAATAVAEEGAKPEATFDLEEVDATIKKIAVLGRVSDEMFADFPFVRDYVNSRLVFMVGSLEDNHLLNGTGGSNQITGVLNTSNIQTEAAGSSATVHDAIFKAMTKIRSVGFFEPDAIVLHPNDWQDIKLSKDSNGQYLAGGPFMAPYGTGNFMAAGQMWGLPVVATTAIAEGTGLVGAFRLGGQIFRREGIRVETTNSDASDFQYNRIAIRVEERLTLAVYRPRAFCTVTGIA